MVERPNKASLSEEEARAAWERALEMQNQAARRAEEEATALVLGGSSVAPVDGGFDVEDVTAAAVEAGIAPEFVRLALAELKVTQEDRARNGGRVGRSIGRWLKDDRVSIEVARTIQATPEAVYAAMQRIFPHPPYALALEDSMGENPLVDGVLVFRVSQGWTDPSAFTMAMLYGSLKQLLVTVRPADETGEKTQVTVRGPLHAHRRGSRWLGLGTGAGLATVGGGGGFALGVGALGVGTLLAPLAGLAAGLALGSAGAVWLARSTYRTGIRKARRGLEDLLKALDVHLRTGGQFDITKPGPSTDSSDGGNPDVFLGN